MLAEAAAVWRGVARQMTKLSRAVLACLSATIMLLIVASIAAADTFTYALNGSYAESNGGPLLIPNGGTLGPDSATGLGTAHSSAVQRARVLMRTRASRSSRV
jgi:hypothetical protein